MKAKILILTLFIGASFVASANGPKGIQKVFQGKSKWTVLDVRSNRPYFEVGETLTIRVDKKFFHDRNNYAKLGGTWTLEEKRLILLYDSFTEERRRIPFEYKIKKWGKDGFMLVYRNKFNKKEKVYLR